MAYFTGSSSWKAAWGCYSHWKKRRIPAGKFPRGGDWEGVGAALGLAQLTCLHWRQEAAGLPGCPWGRRERWPWRWSGEEAEMGGGHRGGDHVGAGEEVWAEVRLTWVTFTLFHSNLSQSWPHRKSLSKDFFFINLIFFFYSKHTSYFSCIQRCFLYYFFWL